MNSGSSPSTLSPRRRNLTLGLIAVVGALNYIDRQIFGIFMPQIGKDLQINHEQLGFIAGLSFSVFYLIAAFPIARLADRGDRPLIIALCVSVWSTATAACALAGSMLQLVLIRIGLAAGEGGAGPASQSLILELYPKERRTLVLSVLLASGAVGLGAGGAIGGWLSQWLDWRGSLVAVGLPGLLVGLAVWLFAAEPRRAGGAAFQAPPRVPLREVFVTIAGSTSLRWTAATVICISTAGFPFLIWAGSFYQTVHAMSPREAGAALFIPITGGLVVGNLLAGWLGDRFSRGRPRYYAMFAALGLMAAFPFGIAMAQAESPGASLAFFFAYNAFLTLHLAPMQALAFAQVPVNQRAMLGATLTMVITLAGVGVGTWLVGGLSTFFAERFGDQSLRYAMTAVCFSIPLGAAFALMAGRTAKPFEENA
ncbi:MAG: MFS transporter [Novosphingobium sp.]|nr:MFS transporter [Novosphingobium sp.]